MPMVGASVARGKDGMVQVGLANLDSNAPVTLTATLAGLAAKGARERF